MSKLIYFGLVFAQVFTFCAYVVVTAGAALLQKKANELTIFNGLEGQALADLTAAYNNVFQSTTYVIPYPQRPWFQFQYQWWIIELQFFCFCITAFATIFPRFIVRVRPVALTFIASALVLVMDNVNALFFLLRSELACTVFDKYRIQVAQAGLMMVGCGNFMTIIFMGLYEHTETLHGDNAMHTTDDGVVKAV